MICLFGLPLIHVDLKFITLADLSRLSEQPVVLWARNPGEIERSVAAMTVRSHAATKLLLGEHVEAIGGLDFFRDQVPGRVGAAQRRQTTAWRAPRGRGRRRRDL